MESIDSPPLKIQLVVPHDKPCQSSFTKTIAFIGIFIWSTALIIVSYHCFENELAIFTSSVSKSILKSLDFDGEGESLLTAIRHTNFENQDDVQEPQSCVSQFDGACANSALKNEASEALPKNKLDDQANKVSTSKDNPLKGLKTENEKSLKVEHNSKIIANDKLNEQKSVKKPLKSAETKIKFTIPEVFPSKKSEDKLTQRAPNNLNTFSSNSKEHQAELEPKKFKRVKKNSSNKQWSKPNYRDGKDNSIRSPEIPTKSDFKPEKLHSQIPINNEILPDNSNTKSKPEDRNSEQKLKSLKNDDPLQASETKIVDTEIEPKPLEELISVLEIAKPHSQESTVTHIEINLTSKDGLNVSETQTESLSVSPVTHEGVTDSIPSPQLHQSLENGKPEENVNTAKLEISSIPALESSTPNTVTSNENTIASEERVDESPSLQEASSPASPVIDNLNTDTVETLQLLQPLENRNPEENVNIPIPEINSIPAVLESTLPNMLTSDESTLSLLENYIVSEEQVDRTTAPQHEVLSIAPVIHHVETKAIDTPQLLKSLGNGKSEENINVVSPELISQQEIPVSKPKEQLQLQAPILNETIIVDGSSETPEVESYQVNLPSPVITPRAVYNSGEIRSGVMNHCIDAGSFEGSKLALYTCHGSGGNQNWMFNLKNEIRKDNLCADYFGETSVLLFNCHGNLGNQRWNYDDQNQTFHHPASNTCLTLLDVGNVGMQSCDDEKDTQKWIWREHPSLQTSTD